MSRSGVRWRPAGPVRQMAHGCRVRGSSHWGFVWLASAIVEVRHACGYALDNKGHDTRAIQGWLGHRSITSTAVYTALAPNRFKDFWRGCSMLVTKSSG
jgi:hypothetical protein